MQTPCDGWAFFFVRDYWVADALEARFRGLYRSTGIKTSGHAGRHTFASTLLRQGVDLERVAILLGHSDVDVTAWYIDVDKRRLREMYEGRFDMIIKDEVDYAHVHAFHQ